MLLWRQHPLVSERTILLTLKKHDLNGCDFDDNKIFCITNIVLECCNVDKIIQAYKMNKLVNQIKMD